MTVYNQLGIVKKCYDALGESGEALKKLCVAEKDYLETRKEINARDDKLQEYCRAHGLGRKV